MIGWENNHVMNVVVFLRKTGTLPFERRFV
jgi:hypothetical protein